MMKGTAKRLPVPEQIRKGLLEAIRHARGEITLKSSAPDLPGRPPEIRADDLTRLRLSYQMSQGVFAMLLNVSTKTVQSWEHGSRRPSQAALRLIQVLRQNPTSVFMVAGMSPPKTNSKGTQSAKVSATKSVPPKTEAKKRASPRPGFVAGR